MPLSHRGLYLIQRPSSRVLPWLISPIERRADYLCSGLEPEPSKGARGQLNSGLRVKPGARGSSIFAFMANIYLVSASAKTSFNISAFMRPVF